MKCRALAIAAALALAACAFAQAPALQPWRLWGNVWATAFGQWSVSSLTMVPAPGTYTLEISTAAPPVLPGGQQFQPLATNAPLLVDPGPNQETVTPSAVSCSWGQSDCMITVTLTKAHDYTFSIESGTDGLQEAINYEHGTGGIVDVDPTWKGTVSEITGASGYPSVEIKDERPGATAWYGWTGSSYVMALGLNNPPGAGTFGGPATLTSLVASSPAISPTSIEGVEYADQFAGADIGAKINAAIAAMPSSGGIVIVPTDLSGGTSPAILNITQNVEVWFQAGAFSVGGVVLNAGAQLIGNGAQTTQLIITGNGGGTCSPGVNGGVQILGNNNNSGRIANLNIEATNPALDCLLNIGGAGNNEVQSLHMHWVRLTTSGIPPAASNPVALEASNVIVSTFDTVLINGNFRQQIVQTGPFNVNHLSNVVVDGNSDDPGAGVWNSAKYEIYLPNCGGCDISALTLEYGPNGILLGDPSNWWNNSTRLQTWAGDPVTYVLWTPATAYALGAYVVPSAITTATTTAGSTSITLASTSNVVLGQEITIVGAGASGSNLDTFITALSGTTATIETSAPTAVTGAVAALNEYAGHLYRVTVAGTSGATAPAWPTSSGGTVADGTATQMEYGDGAMITVNGRGVSVTGSMIENYVAGVVLQSSAIGTIVSGNSFAANGPAVFCDSCQDATLSANSSVGPLLAKLVNNSANFTALGTSHTFVDEESQSGGALIQNGVIATGTYGSNASGRHITGPLPILTFDGTSGQTTYELGPALYNNYFSVYDQTHAESLIDIGSAHVGINVPLEIGGGTEISNSSSIVQTTAMPLSGSLSGSTAALSANTCGDAVVATIPGATAAMTVSLGLSAAPQAGLRPYAYISAVNTVTFEYCNDTTASITPNAQTVQIRVVR